jgi:D-glycerate 3-kinase
MLRCARRAFTMASPELLTAYAAKGPLHDQLTVLNGSPSAADWHRHGGLLSARLTGNAALTTNPEGLIVSDPTMAVRIYHLYLPIYYFVRSQVRTASRGNTSALAVGLSAPQGCGKTTLVNLLVDLFEADGLACAAVSIDDFYLTGAEQERRASEHPANPLLQVRGNAGTHDLPLGTQVLTRLKRCKPGRATAADEPLHIPRYNKAARGGRGDRAPPDSWVVAPGAVDVVLLEGWMLGFSSLPAACITGDAALSAHHGLVEVNARLKDYEEWHELMDAWVVLAVDNVACVYEWRLQAERAMAAGGRPGMSDAQVADFVARYMPAYEAFRPALYAAALAGGVGGKPTMLVRVDASRNPIHT